MFDIVTEKAIKAGFATNPVNKNTLLIQNVNHDVSESVRKEMLLPLKQESETMGYKTKFLTQYLNKFHV